MKYYEYRAQLAQRSRDAGPLVADESLQAKCIRCPHLHEDHPFGGECSLCECLGFVKQAEVEESELERSRR